MCVLGCTALLAEAEVVRLESGGAAAVSEASRALCRVCHHFFALQG